MLTYQEARECPVGSRLSWRDDTTPGADTPCEGTITVRKHHGCTIEWDDGLSCQVEFDNTEFWGLVERVEQ